MADTPGYPDCNPALFAAPGRIALALLADDPRPSLGRGLAEIRPLPIAPTATAGPSEMVVVGRLARDAQGLRRPRCNERSRRLSRRGTDEVSVDPRRERRAVARRALPAARLDAARPSDRAPLRAAGSCPLYSDTFSASIMAISDDRGADLDGQPALDRLRQHPAQPRAQERRHAGRLHARQRSPSSDPDQHIHRRRGLVVAGGRIPLSQPRRGDRGDPAGERPLGPGLQRPAEGPALAGRLALRRRGDELEVDPPPRAVPRRARASSIIRRCSRPATARST